MANPPMGTVSVRVMELNCGKLGGAAETSCLTVSDGVSEISEGKVSREGAKLERRMDFLLASRRRAFA
jgi:hypothetical protein